MHLRLLEHPQSRQPVSVRSRLAGFYSETGGSSDGATEMDVGSSLGDRPVSKFDSTRLNRLEQNAFTTVLQSRGRVRVDEMFGSIASMADDLRRKGETPEAIREAILGAFYDSVPLMRRGQAARNFTIILAKAMVEQAIDALCP